MTLQRVYLIRHGLTDWNADGRWQGFESIPLNETGRMQARALAAHFHRPLAGIYSSDLSRAWETACILGEALQIMPHADPRLREFNLGIFQGYTHDEISKRFPEELAGLRADYMGYRIPNGEMRCQLQARAYAAFQDIVASAPGAEVAIVSHGGTIKMLLIKLLGDSDDLRALHIDNTSITTLERNGDGWHLAEAAMTPHLAFAPSDADMH